MRKGQYKSMDEAGNGSWASEGVWFTFIIESPEEGCRCDFY
jgi:hypothetical protein